MLAYLEGMWSMIQAPCMTSKTLDQQMNRSYPQALATTASELNKATPLSDASLVIIEWI